jgi:hypothetical protein
MDRYPFRAMQKTAVLRVPRTDDEKLPPWRKEHLDLANAFFCQVLALAYAYNPAFTLDLYGEHNHRWYQEIHRGLLNDFRATEDEVRFKMEMPSHEAEIAQDWPHSIVKTRRLVKTVHGSTISISHYCHPSAALNSARPGKRGSKKQMEGSALTVIQNTSFMASCFSFL